MQPRAKDASQGQLFQIPLSRIVAPEHPLIQLAEKIDWRQFEEAFGSLYSPDQGAPGKPIRLMVGLHYLKHTYDLSDEQIVARWVENPYWQYFCGEVYFQHEWPLDPSLMTRWRQRVGDRGMERLLEVTIQTALQLGVLKSHHLKKLVVDTTVQEKAIAFPTDAKLYHQMRQKLVQAAQRHGVVLRQSYVRVGRRALVMQNRYAHAGQFRRARRERKRLKTYLGRVKRDIERKIADQPALQKDFKPLLSLADRLLTQRRDSKNKLYSLHAPEVVCISKGKAHKRYEFGCKAGLVTTAKAPFIVGALAFEGNPYDGHSLAASLEQTLRLLGKTRLDDVYVDAGYQGHHCGALAQVHVVKRRWRRLSRSVRRWYRRRSSIEPIIGHQKQDHRLRRNYLKGVEGDKMNVILAACGFNLRKLLRKVLFALWQLLAGRRCRSSTVLVTS